MCSSKKTIPVQILLKIPADQLNFQYFQNIKHYDNENLNYQEIKNYAHTTKSTNFKNVKKSITF